jgi:hypothetical protein
MQNAWVVSWTGGGKGPTDHEGHKGRNRSWESTLTPIQWVDPKPLLVIPGTPQVGKNFVLDETCPVDGLAGCAIQMDDTKRRMDPPSVSLQRGA